jgi:hypothetical protein
MVKKAIVNLVSPIERYLQGQKRLIDSFVSVDNGSNEYHFLHFVGEESVGSPLHKDNPYAFKIYAINNLRSQGYEQILWLDASIVFVKHFKPIFDWIEEKGFFFEHCGHSVGHWCNEQTLNYFGITREQGFAMPMFSAGFTGLDFTNPKAVEFFNRWEKSMLDGYFKGSWDDHRHDLTCASVIANQMGMVKDFSGGGNYFAYIGSGYGTPQESVICHLLGL